MKRIFIFQHGFGFTKEFWLPLLTYFKNDEIICLDSGYFGDENSSLLSDTDYEYIGIGHSLGFIKLIRSEVKFKKLIGINTFINFLGSDESLSNRRKIEYNIFKSSIINDAILALENFYIRCGIEDFRPNFIQLNKNILMKDLDILVEQHVLNIDCPTLIINSENDLVVPLNITINNFSNDSKITLDIMRQGKHSCGYLYPNVVYNKIMKFI